MGVLDKFLDIMKLSDDDEYDEDDFFDDDEYDDEYEEKPKKSIFRREKTHDESDEDDYELPAKSQQRPARSNNKVTPMRQPARRTGVSMEVCVIKPTSVEDAREITETLLSGRTVILNLEGLDLEVAQRIIDFTTLFPLHDALPISEERRVGKECYIWCYICNQWKSSEDIQLHLPCHTY